MYHSDEPCLNDYLSHASNVEAVAKMIATCKSPYVVGVHGDWGAGKTSFLKKLRLYLSGGGLDEPEFADGNEIGKQLWSQSYRGDGQGFETIWFEAWRYQFEATPVVALLQEIRSHFSFKRFGQGTRLILDEAGKLIFAALASIDEVGKHVGIQPTKIVEAGEKWEKKHLAERLPSQNCRQLLDDAIKTLIGPSKRLVIFVDDLDRCQGAVAFRLLEAMKIYFSIPSCIFVLGLDWQNIKKAVAAEMATVGLVEKDSADRGLIHASDYLNKLCQSVHPLPLIVDIDHYLRSLFTAEVFLNSQGQLDDGWVSPVRDYDLLTKNPRKIKAFVNALSMYLMQLRQVIPGHGPIDKQLAIIVAALRFNEDRVFRILESDVGFWSELAAFCESGVTASTHDVFKGRTLSYKPGSTPQPAYPDPADERVFRAARLIRTWNGGMPPTDDDFVRYVQLRQIRIQQGV